MPYSITAKHISLFTFSNSNQSSPHFVDRARDSDAQLLSPCYPLRESRTTPSWHVECQNTVGLVCMSISLLNPIKIIGIWPHNSSVRQTINARQWISQAIPAHLSTLPPRFVGKEHPINYKDHTDIIELFSLRRLLSSRHTSEKVTQSVAVCGSGAPDVLSFLCDCDKFSQSGKLGFWSLKFWSYSHALPSASLFKCSSKGTPVKVSVKADGNSYKRRYLSSEYGLKFRNAFHSLYFYKWLVVIADSVIKPVCYGVTENSRESYLVIYP